MRPLWLLSDPDLNPQFRRRWLDPPRPQRKRPGAASTAHRPNPKTTINSASNHKAVDSDGEAPCRAHAAAVALFFGDADDR